MNYPVTTVLKHYTWHQFLMPGEWVEDINLTYRRGTFKLRFDIYEWLIRSTNGPWSRHDGHTTLVFIRDKNDAIMFKLTWGGL